ALPIYLPFRGLQHVAGDPLRLHDHHGEMPLGLVPRGGEAVHVVRPPQALQRHDDVVQAQLLLAGELQLVGQREQRLDRFPEGRAGVRIAVSVDHQVLQRRNVDDAELPAAGAVAVELLEIGLGHARTLAGTTDTDDANEGADPPATALLGAVGRPTMPLWLCGLCSLCGALRLLRHRRPSRDRIARAPGLACRPRWWWRSSSCIARAPGARF